jgi:flagellar biosynthetic protein FlhB
MSEKGTEPGSAERKKKARQQGDSVHSRELLSAVALLGGVLALGGMSARFVPAWRTVFEQSLASAARLESSSDLQWRATVQRMLGPALLPLGLVMAASFSGASLVGVAQGGGLEIHPNAVGFRFEKLNPLTNAANLFSLRSATRFAKSIVPGAAMVLFGWHALRDLVIPMPVMSLVRLPHAFSAAYGLTLDAAFVTLAWSGLDYAVEWIAWNKRLRMTKQEVRDEMKQTQGSPQLRRRVRQAQNAMRKRKAKADISRASVVVTNPTHYAVALEFSFETMQAPTVLAKGRDLRAKALKDEARWAGVPLIENPPLARSLYASVEPGQAIPFELYAAVAGILAYLYRQKVEEKLRAERQRHGR